MKMNRIGFFVLCAAVLLSSSCGTIETSATAEVDRVLEGTVNFSGSIPAGAEIVVRVVEPPSSEPRRAVAGDLPVVAQPIVQRVERVLGETKHTVTATTMQPLPFRVEYKAHDAVLRRGVNVDVRVTIGGKVRMRTVNGHVLTQRSAAFKQDVAVQSVQ